MSRDVKPRTMGVNLRQSPAEAQLGQDEVLKQILLNVQFVN
jgi:hypothetical protein